MATRSTRTTTVVTEVPDQRYWQGRDWIKALVAGGLALSLLRPSVGEVPLSQPTAAALATAQPAQVATVVPTPVPAPTVSAPLNPPAVSVPQILSTREVIRAGSYTIRGNGTPGATIELLINGTSVGTTTVAADGSWALPTTLEAGTNTLEARAVDPAGTVLAAADPIQLAVEPAPIAAPSLDLPTGDLPGGPISLSGSGLPGSRVRVVIDGVPSGVAQVGDDGRWSLDTIISVGQRTLVVEALDPAGNPIAGSEPVTVTVAGGLGVVLNEPREGAVIAPGPLTISGSGAPGTTLEILDGDRILDTTTIGADGNWRTTVELEAGTASISVREPGSEQILNRPVRITVGEAPPVAAGCGAELQSGCPAWVTRQGGLQLRMRASPAIADNIVTRLPIGTELILEAGPVSADGFTWWQATSKGGNQGWVSGENLVTQPD